MGRFRNRPVQAASLLSLSSVLTAFVAFTPLYDRAMQREATAQQLTRAPGSTTGLTITSTARFDIRTTDVGEARQPPLPVRDLERLVPDRIRGYYDAPVVGSSADATVVGGAPSSAGKLLAQPGQCRLVRIVEGDCPNEPGDVLVSRADGDLFDLAPGDRVEVTGEQDAEELPSGFLRPVDTVVRLTVVGSYESQEWREPDDRWAGQRLGGLSGTLDPGPPEGIFHDAWLTDPSTFTANELGTLPTQSSYVASTLDEDAVGPDEVALLADEIEGLRQRVDSGGDTDIEVTTSIGDVASAVDAQADQARVTVPLLMAQLALLSLVVLWLALGAAAQERRPEVALVRLRGRGRRGARRFLAQELVPIVLAGVPPGAVLAIAGCSLLQLWLLSADDLLPELGRRFVLALVMAALLLVAAVVLTAHRISLEPVSALFRRVPARRSTWRLGVLPAVTLAASAAALAAILGGEGDGVVALAVPALLALVAGVLLGHLAGPLLGLVGRLLLRRGRLTGGIALLDSARSGSAARTVTMVTVAAGLAVFSANALMVGERNWTTAAEHEAGAPVVVEATGGAVAQLIEAAAQADPSGEHVTPVVRMRPPGTDAASTMAIVPDEFAQVALFPGGPPPAPVWSSLAVPEAEPVRLTGRRARLQLAVPELRARGSDGEPVLVKLWLELRTPAGGTKFVRLDDDVEARTTTRVDFTLPCIDGCAITGLRVLTEAGSTATASLVLDALLVDGNPVSLNPAGGWQRTRTPETVLATTAQGAALRVDVRTSGASYVDLLPNWLPSSVPVVATEALADELDDRELAVPGLDGLDVPARLMGTVPHAPASSDFTLLTNLHALERLSPGPPDAAMEIWMDSSSRLPAVRRALTDSALVGGEIRTLAALDREQRSTTAAWSLHLALAVGVLGLVVAALALLVVAAAGWRARSRDLAALRLGGASSRGVRNLSVLAQLPAVLIGVVAGTVVGVVGAEIALPLVPLFATDPEVSLLDLATAWGAVVGAAAIALLVLAGASVLAGLALARRARIDRLRETV